MSYYICPICGIVKSRLQAHIRMKYRNERNTEGPSPHAQYVFESKEEAEKAQVQVFTDEEATNGESASGSPHGTGDPDPENQGTEGSDPVPGAGGSDPADDLQVITK